MSIAKDIMERHGDSIRAVHVDKDAVYHGEDAVKVLVDLVDGRTVEGTFTKDPRASFGGVVFAGGKEIAYLMIAKVKSVLDGTYDKS